MDVANPFRGEIGITVLEAPKSPDDGGAPDLGIGDVDEPVLSGSVDDVIQVLVRMEEIVAPPAVVIRSKSRSPPAHGLAIPVRFMGIFQKTDIGMVVFRAGQAKSPNVHVRQNHVQALQLSDEE